jgi:hypothetical protein
MDLQLTPQHLKFRDELRAWLKANIARPWRESSGTRSTPRTA